MSQQPKPSYLWSIFTMKCPRCRRGPMFKEGNPYKRLGASYIFNMHEHCPVCNQKYEMETGFWYGTGYVSYALAVALSVATFLAWWVFIGISVDDNRVFAWLGFNAFFLIAAQPWLMRLSRVIYLYFFVKYDPDYEVHEPKRFDA